MSNLKKIREKFGLTQQEVAHWLGISRSLVQFYEHGARGLPTQALLQLAKLELMVAVFDKEVTDGLHKHSGDNNEISLDAKNNNDRFDTLEVEKRTPDFWNIQPYGSEGSRNAAALPGGDAVPLPVPPQQAFQLRKADMLHRELSVLQSRHAVLQDQMLLIKKMLDGCTEDSSEKEKLWLQMLYHSVCCKLAKFDESKQLSVKAKIMVIRLKHEFMNKKAG